MLDQNHLLQYLENINTFNDIYQVTKKLSTNEKGDLFEIITFYTFKLCPLLNNNNITNNWLYDDIPLCIKKELNLPEKDKGIDLLIEIENEYYAIQCKFRQDINTCISWTELSTFFGLSFGMNNKIKGGFFVTNTYDLCQEVINSEKVQPIYGDFFFENLPTNFFRNICAIIKNKKVMPYTIKSPFKHQTECIDKCKDYYNNNTKGYIEMACGSGKTLCSYWIDKQMNNNRTVIFVPSIYLLSQFYSDWINQSYAEQISIKYLLIGSDMDVDNEVKYKTNGLLLCTDQKEIRKFIDNCNEKLVVICTYQSSDKLSSACNLMRDFEFGIFDEAHKTVGRVGKAFSRALNDDFMIIDKRLFMTATPKIYGGELDDDESIVSMDYEEYYGEEIYCYNTGNAINDKRLVDYQVVSVYTTNTDIEYVITAVF